MLRYDTPADAPTDRPIRRLLILVLLMAMRDKADQIRFNYAPDLLSLWYRVDGTWYELVPPPAMIWPGIVAEFRQMSRLVSPELGTGWRSAVRRLIARPAGLAAGWLTFRLHGRDHLYMARLDPGPVRGEVLLEVAGSTAGEPEGAEAVLGELMRRQDGDLHVEFEDAPETWK
jgi:hypothetical protein